MAEINYVEMVITGLVLPLVTGGILNLLQSRGGGNNDESTSKYDTKLKALEAQIVIKEQELQALQAQTKSQDDSAIRQKIQVIEAEKKNLSQEKNEQAITQDGNISIRRRIAKNLIFLIYFVVVGGLIALVLYQFIDEYQRYEQNNSHMWSQRLYGYMAILGYGIIVFLANIRYLWGRTKPPVIWRTVLLYLGTMGTIIGVNIYNSYEAVEGLYGFGVILLLFCFIPVIGGLIYNSANNI